MGVVLKVTLTEKFQESEDVISFIFKPEESLEWKAGQFIYYKIPHQDPDNRGMIRHFTISSAPHERNLRITTKFVPEGGSSLKRALKDLKIGDTIDAFSLEGSFTIDNPENKYVFIAGGIGITPYRAILSDLAKKEGIGDIILFYGNRDENIVFKPELDQIAAENPGLKIYYIISPKRIDFDLLHKNVPGLFDRQCYISGPMQMIKAIEASVIENGVSGDKIKTDYFSGY